MYKTESIGAGIWRWTVLELMMTAVIVGSLVFDGTALAQQGSQVFQLQNTDQARQLDRNLLQEEFQFGKATVVLDLDSRTGEVSETRIAMDSPRLGRPEYAEKLQSIMSSWRYTAGAGGSLYITVSVPAVGSGENGSPGITIDTGNLIPGGSVEVVTSQSALNRMVAQQGFSENISLKSATAAVVAEDDEARRSTLQNVWDHLGPGFQIVFVAIFLLLMLAIVMTARKINTRWEPNGGRRNLLHALRRSKNGDVQGFTSPQSKMVEDLWRRAIENTYFGPELFQSLPMAAINRNREKIERPDFQGGVVEFEEMLKECRLQERLGNDFIYYTDSLSEVKKEVSDYLENARTADLSEEKRARLLRDIDKCYAIYRIEETLDANDLLEDFEEQKQSLRRSAKDLQREIRYILKNLQEIHDLFISKNGSLNHGERGSADKTGSSSYSLTLDELTSMRESLEKLGSDPDPSEVWSLIREYELESQFEQAELMPGEGQSLNEMKDHVRKRLGYALLEREQEAEQVTGLMERIKRSGSLEQIERLLQESGYQDIVHDLQTEYEVSGQRLKEQLDSFIREQMAHAHETGENGVRLRSGVEIPEPVENKYSKFLWDYFGKPHIDEALRICRIYKKRYPLFEIFESGLRNHLVNQNDWWTSQEVDRSVDRTAAMLIEERRDPLDTLWAIGSLSPMVGLFGTVWGISQAFGKIRGVTETRMLMQKLAGDINVALATTIVGLVLGLVAFFVYYYFNYSLDKDASRLEKHFTEITNAL